MFILAHGHNKHPLRCVAFSPDGTRLAACGNGGEARVWDLASRECIHSLSFHWDNLTTFFGAGGHELFTHDVTRALRAHPVGAGPSRRVGQAHLVTPAPDGRRVFCRIDEPLPVLTCHSLDTFARLWATPCHEVPGEQLAPPESLSCSGDGKRLACGHRSGRVSILDVDTGAWIIRTGNAGSGGGARAIAIAPGGDGVAWCAASNLHFERLPDRFTAHHRIGRTHFLGIAWHPSGSFFATTNGDGKVDTWDGRTGERRSSLDWGVGKLSGIAFAPSGHFAAACSHTGQLVVWDVDH